MLRVLLAKDLRHAVRNPLPWIINLIVPLSMTLLVGLIFGGMPTAGRWDASGSRWWTRTSRCWAICCAA